VSALETIFARRSIGRLTDPAPSPNDLDTIVRAGAAAPDHKSLRPWRFVVLDGPAKDAFGEVLAEAYTQRCVDCDKDEVPAKREKERTKLGRAPLVVVVAAIHRGDAVPFVEQFAAAAAAAQNMLLAATELGYGSMWRTGDPAYDEHVKAALGLRPEDAIVGFLYLGTPHPDGDKPANDPDTSDVMMRWSPA
jgi:nitroreductase